MHVPIIGLETELPKSGLGQRRLLPLARAQCRQCQVMLVLTLAVRGTSLRVEPDGHDRAPERVEHYSPVRLRVAVVRTKGPTKRLQKKAWDHLPAPTGWHGRRSLLHWERP